MKKFINKTKQWLAKVFVYNLFGRFSPLFLGAGALLFLVNPIVAIASLVVGVGLATTSITQNVILDRKVKHQDIIIEDYVSEKSEEQKTQTIIKTPTSHVKHSSKNTDGVER